MSNNQVDVSILIVSYNTRDMTIECIESIFEETRSHSFEVILIDNDSKDGSADAIEERFPEVKLIRSEKNLGFALANNVASEQSSGRRTLLLNPDTVIVERAIDKLIDFADENPDCQACEACVCYGHEQMHKSLRRGVSLLQRLHWSAWHVQYLHDLVLPGGGRRVCSPLRGRHALLLEER